MDESDPKTQMLLQRLAGVIGGLQVRVAMLEAELVAERARADEAERKLREMH